MCEVSGGAGSFTAASRLTGTSGCFCKGTGGGVGVDLPYFICSNILKVNEPRSNSPPSPQLSLATGSGNVDTRSGEQPQKPQESPREEAGREGEVEPWNALGGVSRLFTS